MITEEQAAENRKKLGQLMHSVGRELYFHSSWGIRQTEILKMLYEGPMTQKDIQERLGVKPATISELISKLETKGMVSRGRSDEDHRVVVITLTEEGKHSARRRMDENIVREAGIPLEPEEIAQLVELLEKLERGFADKDSKQDS